MPGYTQPAAVVLDTIFSSKLSLYKKIKDIECFLPQILMIKESCSLIGQEHLLVYINWNYVYCLDGKNALVWLYITSSRKIFVSLQFSKISDEVQIY